MGIHLTHFAKRFKDGKRRQPGDLVLLGGKIGAAGEYIYTSADLQNYLSVFRPFYQLRTMRFNFTSFTAIAILACVVTK